MTNASITAGFTAAEFAELHCTIGDLHSEWFPRYEGFHPADMPPAARLVQDAHRLVALVAARDGLAHLTTR